MKVNPLWPPRTQMAYLALISAVAGSGVVTILLGVIIHILWLGGWAVITEAQRIAALAIIAYGLIALVFISMMSFGTAINRRSASISGPGGVKVDFSGGQDDPAAATVVTTTATTVTPGPGEQP